MVFSLLRPSDFLVPPEIGTRRWVESTEERAARLVRVVKQFGKLPGSVESTGTGVPNQNLVQDRIAARLEAADTHGEVPAGMRRALAQKAAHTGLSTAQQLILGELRLDDLTEDSVANLESVIRVIGRPAWFVCYDAPEPPERDLTRDDECWIAKIDAAGKALRRICGQVGVVKRIVDGNPVPIGTAWMIGTDTMITNAHVAAGLARQVRRNAGCDARDGWNMLPGIQAAVDFAFEHELAHSERCEIEDVLFVQTSRVPDIAVFRLRGAAPPARIEIDLSNRTHWQDADVFTVGHPIRDGQGTSTAPIVFGKLDGTKRFSPGKTIGVLGGTVLAHDCSTTNGSSGSPVIDFVSLEAVGLHYFGMPDTRNESVLLAAYADHPAIVKSRQPGGWN